MKQITQTTEKTPVPAEVLSYLNQDPLLHITMLENLRHGWAEVLAANPHGVLIRQGEGPTAIPMLTADSPAAALELVAALPETDVMLVHQPSYISLMQERYNLPQANDCYSLARFTQDPLPVPDIGAEFRVLGTEYLQPVARQYQVLEETYLRQRLAGGTILGAFLGGELAGFIGEHDERTLGMLEVLPAFRRRHVGAALVAHAINAQLAAGRVPMGHVYTDNQISLDMQRGLGFSVSQGTVTWLS